MTPIISKDFHTGFYIFDVEHIKINGKWKYFFLIIDAVSSRIINYQLWDKENKKNLKDFLDESDYVVLEILLQQILHQCIVQ